MIGYDELRTAFRAVPAGDLSPDQGDSLIDRLTLAGVDYEAVIDVVERMGVLPIFTEATSPAVMWFAYGLLVGRQL